eukprot:TRINITY_DN4340_c0_g1_i6.p1 TRINITY_DN4340_c0_g1~~TRINITY_DN4340_c0_g1_i6.p1  ORF type:complete len:324 (-),score=93.14 TRINITY_DN4340_c0_g1_i6:248-1219(-)
MAYDDSGAPPLDLDDKSTRDIPTTKLFIGGVSYHTTDESFRNFFAQFGEIEDVVLMRDREGRSRGFGFVTFREKSSAAKVMKQTLELDGRRVDPLYAVPKEQMGSAAHAKAAPVKKIFVGGLPLDFTVTDLKNYFSAYGNITDTMIVPDRTTGKSRGFGFVTFEHEDEVEKVLSIPNHSVDGKTNLNIKKAEPKRPADERDRFDRRDRYDDRYDRYDRYYDRYYDRRPPYDYRGGRPGGYYDRPYGYDYPEYPPPYGYRSYPPSSYPPPASPAGYSDPYAPPAPAPAPVGQGSYDYSSMGGYQSSGYGAARSARPDRGYHPYR